MAKKLLVLGILVLVSAPAFAQDVDTAWVRRYNGPGNGQDHPYRIAVDDSGNVYVAGSIWGSGTERDYGIIRYYPNGDTAWVRTYNGSGNLYDAASDMTIHASGNIYVTGISYRNETCTDYATIKYYPNGDTAWVRRYNEPGDSIDVAEGIAVDVSGNAYVTGRCLVSGGAWYYATIKYYPNGDTAWVRRGSGTAFDIVVDSSANAYVTGSFGTIKYDSDGNLLWIGFWGGYMIAVDSSGNICVAARSWSSKKGYDYTTIKYYPNGDTAWIRSYNGPGNGDDWVEGIVVDRFGNVYVTGGSLGTGTSYDYATIKYYPDGDTAWVRRYNGQENAFDWANAVATDGSGNVYVTGYIVNSATREDYTTVKYYPNGDTAWVRTYNGPGNDLDDASAIAVDDSGNVYVTGRSMPSGTSWAYDYATIKYVQFLCGDVNKDGVVDIADVVYLINYLFIGGPAPDPIQAGDVNLDGVVNIADVVYLVNYLFMDGSPPCEP